MEDSKVTHRKRILIPLIILAVAAALAAATAGAYLGLCRWVQTNGRLLPGVTVVDDKGAVVADLGKAPLDAAESELTHKMDRQLETQKLTIRYGQGHTATLAGADQTSRLIDHSPLAVLDKAMADKESQPFWKLGALWLGMVKEPVSIPLSTAKLTEEGRQAADDMAQKIARELYVAPVEAACTVDEENVTVVKGTDGQEVDAGALAEDICAALLAGGEQLSVQTRTVPCQEITADALNDLVYVEPQPPVKDENGNMVPAVIGVSIDIPSAQEALDAIGPGESCSIPLVFTSPKIENGGSGTQDNPYAEGIYYNDLLATVTTNLDGVATRSHNVGVAAQSCNGAIIAPGATFSYLRTIGDPSLANGYQQSTGYQGGLTVDMVGGGICQVSSSLYYCAVYSNLEIVRRAAHAFATGYIPNGLDATVYYPSLDFQFRNNTGYPIKVVSYTTGGAWGTLTVRLYGTNPDGHYVKTERYTTSTTEWETVYKPDPTIPQGTTKVDVTPYTGYEVDVYRLVYSRSGALLSRTFENHSRYAKRDKVILYNPADSGPWGEGVPEPPASEPPVTEPPVSEPPVTEPPVVSDPPVSEPPVSDPPVSEPPAVTDPPAESEPPATEEPQPQPSEEPGPEPTQEPEPVPEQPEGPAPEEAV